MSAALLWAMAMAWAGGSAPADGVALAIPWEVVKLVAVLVAGALGGGGLARKVGQVVPGLAGSPPAATTEGAAAGDASTLEARVVALESRAMALESGLLAGLADVRGRLDELEDESGLRDETRALRAAIERLERAI